MKKKLTSKLHPDLLANMGSWLQLVRVFATHLNMHVRISVLV